MKLFFSLLIISCLTATLYSGEYFQTKLLTAEGVELLEAECGAGSLSIEGYEGESIELEALIKDKFKSENELKENIGKDIIIELLTSGKKAMFTSKVKSKFFNHTTIDVKLKIPNRLICHIDDGSGSLKIRGIKNKLKVKDGSGSCEIRDIKGDLYIDDGSGSITLSNINGHIKIDDGSGSINIDEVKGNVEIDDGSGSIDVDDIKGKVDIRDASGSINVSDTTDDIIIDDGSGSIDVRNTEGKLVIKSDGSGSLNTRDIKGGVER